MLRVQICIPNPILFSVRTVLVVSRCLAVLSVCYNPIDNCHCSAYLRICATTNFVFCLHQSLRTICLLRQMPRTLPTALSLYVAQYIPLQGNQSAHTCEHNPNGIVRRCIPLRAKWVRLQGTCMLLLARLFLPSSVHKLPRHRFPKTCQPTILCQ